MSQTDFLAKVAVLYRAMNFADTTHPARVQWMPDAMAGYAGCQHLDSMLHAMVKCGAISAEQHQAFLDTL